MRYVLFRKDRPGLAELRAELQPAHAAYQAPFLEQIRSGGGLVGDETVVSSSMDIRNVTGNLIVFEAERKTVEDFHENDPYTQSGLFEVAYIEAIRQRVPDPNG